MLPNHTRMLQNIAVGSIDPSIDGVKSNLNLKMSVECKRSEAFTWDAITQCDQNGDLESD